jgi:glucokinase
LAVLALDIGGTQLRAAAVDASGRLLTRASARTIVQEGPEAVMRRSVKLLESVRDQVEGHALAAIGVSAPGPLDPVAGAWIQPPNMGPAFRGAPIAQPLKDALGLPTVVDRDTHVAALAEQAFGAAREARDFIYITLSTGVGGAIVTEGRLLRGPDGVAGEIGHLTVELDGAPCGCGARGHLEALASGSAIARAATAAANEGRSAALSARLSKRPLEASDVAAAEDEGDPASREIMEHARRSFAAAVVGLVNVLNPELIVVGGGIAEAQPERWLGPTREAVAREAFIVPGRRVRIVQAALGPDVGLVGAVPLVRARTGSLVPVGPPKLD